MRCPVCKAENAQGPNCRRCKADLSLLFALDDQRGRDLDAARRALARGEWRRAAEYAAAANWLRADEESHRLLAVARVLGRDFAGALAEYRAVRAGGRGGNGVPGNSLPM